MAPWLALGRFLQTHALIPGLAGSPAVGLSVYGHECADLLKPVHGLRMLRVQVGLAGIQRVLQAGLPLAGVDAEGHAVGVVDARPTDAPDIWRVRVVPPSCGARRGLRVLPWAYALRSTDGTAPLVTNRREDLRAARRSAAAALL